MISKIYLAFLGLSIAVMAFLTYYAWSWLQSIGAPATAVAEFQYYSGLVSTILWISTVVLLVLANMVLWAGRAWAIWTTFLFFAIFAVLRYFGLLLAYISFQMRNDSAGMGASSEPVIGVVLIILMAAITFFDQFIVTRLRAKTFAETAEEVTTTSETPAE